MRLVEEGKALLVDVREAAEHAYEAIPGAVLAPLSRIDSHDFTVASAKHDAAIFHCSSGARTTVHARRFVQTGFAHVYVLAGGIQAWKRAGLPTSAQ